MPRRKKKFIDPKIHRTTTFSLVHRSQRDPLAADPDAPQHVLRELGDDVRKRKEEERKFGVFYEDDYNYMQHLKDRAAPEYDFSEFDRFVVEKNDPDPTPATSAAAGGLNLPSEVFATRGPEEEVGLLNRAAPRSGPLLDWDPDIVETLDDEFGHEKVYTLGDLEHDDEDELDDIFRAALTGEGVEEDKDSDDGDASDFDSDFGGGRSDEEEDDDVPELAAGGRLFAEEETRSRFTSYSMSSSVIRRNEQLALLDGRFERFFEEYDDLNVGGLETEDIEGRLNADVDKKVEEEPGDLVMKSVLAEFEKNREEERQKPPEVDEKHKVIFDEEPMERNVRLEEEEEEEKDRFDCQSVLSTYSNIYNRPKLISERRSVDPIRISGRTGMPKDVLGKGLTAGALKRLDRENAGLLGGRSSDEEESETRTLASRVSELSFRNRHETPEEKRARKQAMKELKRERRVERKLNREAFRKEQQRQEKQIMHQQKNAVKIL